MPEPPKRPPEKKLLGQVRDAIRVTHYSEDYWRGPSRVDPAPLSSPGTLSQGEQPRLAEFQPIGTPYQWSAHVLGSAWDTL
jgi:hypothetical protein